MFALAIGLSMVGCKATLSNSGKVIASSSEAVDAAMKGWASYVVLYKPPISQEDQVRSMLMQYRQIEHAAKITYANAYVAANSGSTNVMTASQNLDAALAALEASKATLLQVISTFSVNQNTQH